MKFRFLYLFCLFLLLTMLCGCSFTTSGNSLEAFSQRMNCLNENYNMNPNGYIVDTSQNTLTKFYKFTEKEIMLKFKYDSKNRLTQMHIVFDLAVLEKSDISFSFISDCIVCFCQNESTSDEILGISDFNNILKTVKNETTVAQVGDIKIEIDSTRLGTVISLYKDI